jgi:hypothetical protein
MGQADLVTPRLSYTLEKDNTFKNLNCFIYLNFELQLYFSRTANGMSGESSVQTI